MKETTKDQARGIQWSLSKHLEDIHFAEDVPLFQQHNNMTQNSESMRETAAMTGLEINIQKTNSLRVNQGNNAAETKYCAIRILNTKRVDFVKAVLDFCKFMFFTAARKLVA